MYSHGRVLRGIAHCGTYGRRTSVFFCHSSAKKIEVCIFRGKTQSSLGPSERPVLTFWRDVSGGHHCSVSFAGTAIYAASKSEMLDILEDMSVNTRLAIRADYSLYQPKQTESPLLYAQLICSNMFFRRYIHCERS